MRDFSETLRRLYEDGDDRIYEVILGCTVEEVKYAIMQLQKHDLVGTYELVNFLESQLDYITELDRELNNADE